MAQRRQKDLINRLADVGEEAFTRVAGSQATSRLIESVGGMRERLDDVQKKVRGLDALERRVANLEQRLEDLDKPKSRSAGTTRSRASAPKKSTGGSGRSSASGSGGSGTSRPRSSGSSSRSSGSGGSGTRKKPSS